MNFTNIRQQNILESIASFQIRAAEVIPKQTNIIPGVTFCVYLTTNIVNRKRYIGKTNVKKHQSGYLGSGLKFKEAIKKYGRESFRSRIIRTFKDEIEALEFETKLIEKYDASNSNKYYNAVDGVRSQLSGWQHTEKAKEAIRQKNMKPKPPRSKAHCEAISKAKKGVPMKQEHKDKISAAKKGKKYKKRSDETKAKLRNARKGRTWIHNVDLKKCTCAKPEDLGDYIKDGWKIGRFKFE